MHRLTWPRATNLGSSLLWHLNSKFWTRNLCVALVPCMLHARLLVFTITLCTVCIVYQSRYHCFGPCSYMEVEFLRSNAPVGKVGRASTESRVSAADRGLSTSKCVYNNKVCGGVGHHDIDLRPSSMCDIRVH